MSWEQLIEMNNCGMEIQSHTFSHEPLETLPLSAVEEELLKSKEILEKRLNKAVNFISYPHGSCNKNIFKITKKFGYQGGCTSVAGVFNSHYSFCDMKRIDVRRSYNLSDFEKIVNINFLFLKKIIIITAVKKLLQNLVGIDNWNKLYKKRYH